MCIIFSPKFLELLLKQHKHFIAPWMWWKSNDGWKKGSHFFRRPQQQQQKQRQTIPLQPLNVVSYTDRICGWGITQSVRNICSICFVLQWTVCQNLRAPSSKNETLTSLSHLINEGTIIILLKLPSKRKMEWNGALRTQYTHMLQTRFRQHTKKERSILCPHPQLLAEVFHAPYKPLPLCVLWGVKHRWRRRYRWLMTRLRSPVTADRIEFTGMWEKQSGGNRCNSSNTNSPQPTACYLPSCP